MKQFSLIYKDGTPFLRQRNPLVDNRNLISVACYEEHERAYVAEAIKILEPSPGQREYFGSELEMLWRFTEDGGETWIETSEPNFIGTNPENFEHVFKVKPRTNIPYQERVKVWVGTTFNEDVVTDIPERCFRFMEEAIELGQSLGMTREDMYRLITYTYSRPVGDPEQEIGGVMVTLNGLATAVGLDVLQVAEKGLSDNIKNSPAIREKWLTKIAVLPIP